MNAADLKSRPEKEGYSDVIEIQPDAKGYSGGRPQNPNGGFRGAFLRRLSLDKRPLEEPCKLYGTVLTGRNRASEHTSSSQCVQREGLAAFSHD